MRLLQIAVKGSLAVTHRRHLVVARDLEGHAIAQILPVDKIILALVQVVVVKHLAISALSKVFRMIDFVIQIAKR